MSTQETKRESMNSSATSDIPLANVVVGRDQDDLKIYGTKGTIEIGKHIVGTGEDAHITTPFLVDALRPHIIVITGKRGQGKCLLPGSPVLLANGEERSIDQLFSEVQQPDPSKSEELIECSGIEVVCIDQNLNMAVASVSHVYKKRVNEKVIVLKTKNGKEIICTKEHPILSIEDEIIWRASDEMKPNLAIGTCITSLSSSKGQLSKQHLLSWDEISEVKEIDYNGNVFDLTVPTHHNFVSNGIVCHNSYTMGIIAEELRSLDPQIRNNLCSVIIDSQGIFWTMKQPNDREQILLEKWKLNSKSFDIKMYVPEQQKEFFDGSGIPYDGLISISPSELSSAEWTSVLGIESSSKAGILLDRTLKHLEGHKFSLKELIQAVKPLEGFEDAALYLQSLISSAEGWGVFGQSGIPEFIEPSKISVIDVSLTPPNVRSLLVSIICSNLLKKRIIARRREDLTGEKSPMCWLMIDEAHNFVPSDSKTISSETLLTIAKEGRQPGMTLVLATQRPEKLHEDILAQTDLLVSHRLTAKGDIDALKKIMQTYISFPIEQHMAELPRKKGTALVLDDNSERLYKVMMRPRKSAHAGGSPAAI